MFIKTKLKVPPEVQCSNKIVCICTMSDFQSSINVSETNLAKFWTKKVYILFCFPIFSAKYLFNFIPMFNFNIIASVHYSKRPTIFPNNVWDSTDRHPGVFTLSLPSEVNVLCQQHEQVLHGKTNNS